MKTKGDVDPEAESRRAAAVLLDEVLRGERPLLFPPGTLVASILVPAFAVGLAALVMGVGLALVSSPIVLPLSALVAVALVAVAAIGHVLVVRGQSHHRRWLRGYARGLMACAVLGAVIAGAARLPVPWVLVGTSIVAFGASDLILGSRAYLGFAAFLSLKRQYRENQGAARARVLGHKP